MPSFETIKHLAQSKALEAVHQNRPVAAREWLEVAAVAEAASRGQYPPPTDQMAADFERAARELT